MKKWKLVQTGLLMAVLLLAGCAGRQEVPDRAVSELRELKAESTVPASAAQDAAKDGETPEAESAPEDVEAPEDAAPERERADWRTCPVVAHAMGTVDGRVGTNSLDAFLESYEAGQRVFEVDLQLTSDGHLVARHDWDQMSYYNTEQVFQDVMDLETFLDTPICFFYTPVDIDGIVSLMQDYPDVYFVTDSKDTGEDAVRAQMKEIARAIKEADDPALWEQLIVQIYHEDMYDWVSEEAPVVNWIFTLYQIASPDYDEIGAFCQKHDIPVVTIAAERLNKDSSSILHSYDRLVYVHTVDRLRAMLEMSWAADGFYSDYVTPGQYEAAVSGKNQMYLSSGLEEE